MIRGKILLAALLAMGAAAAVLGIVQMWWEPMAWEIFVKTMISLVVSGVLVSFLVAVDYDLPGSRGKIMLAALVVLAVTGAALILGQIWFTLFSKSIFWKLLVTVAILAGLVSFVMVVREDLGANKKLRDEKYID